MSGGGIGSTRTPAVRGVVAGLLIFAGCESGVRTPTSPAFPEVDEQKAVIEALLLGTGPLAARQHGCRGSGLWTGFPAHSAVRVRVSTTLFPEQRAALDAFLAQIPAATAGNLEVRLELTAETDPTPAWMEVTITNLFDQEVEALCSKKSEGCSAPALQTEGVLASARVVTRNRSGGALQAHELAHALLGLCHLDGDRVAGALMAQPRGESIAALSALEMSALRAVYAAGLGPGASRDDLERAGLIGPGGAAAAAAPGGALVDPAAPDESADRFPGRWRDQSHVFP